MSSIEKLNLLKAEIPASVSIVAVSKTKPISAIETLYHAGQLDFGENKVQEMVGKFETLPKEIRWHLIGHLQRNKVKYIANFVHLIHSVDNVSLLQEIDKQAKKSDRKISCLLQVKVAKEDTKYGMNFEELADILNDSNLKFPNVKLVGLMCMATFTEDVNQIRQEFKTLKRHFDSLKKQYPDFKFLSMGMSSDYKIAIEEGSTMIRVGSSIFGERN